MRFEKLCFPAVLSLLVGAAFACSDSSGGGGGDGGTSSSSASSTSSGSSGEAGSGSITPGCKAYGEAYCATLFRCKPFEAASEFGDVAACATSHGAWCNVFASFPGDQQQTPACAAALTAQACEAFGAGDTAPACLGTVEANGPCVNNNQCKTGHCSAQSYADCGVCDSPTEGSPCSKSGQCRTDQDCNKSEQKCQNQARKGEACLGRTCVGSDLRCDTAGDANQCVDKGSEGDACGGVAQLDCKSGLFCSEATDKCQPYVLVEKGEALGPGKACKGSTAGGLDTCTPTPRLGEPCESSCALGLECSDKVCVLAPARTNPCP